MNLTFEYGLVPVIDKLTSVTKNTANALNHIITDSLIHGTINTGIIKLDVSDHFPVFLIAETEKRMTPGGEVEITKRLINNKTEENFKKALKEMAWYHVISSKTN